MTQGAQSPKKARGSRREQIIQAAIELFSTQAYEDVSVDDLCRGADVAKGLVFYHFTDKRGVFAAAVEQVWGELGEYQRPLSDESDPASRMRGSLRRHFDYVQRHPKRFTMLMTAGVGDAKVRDVITRARMQAAAGFERDLGCPTNPPPRLRQAIRGWIGFLDNATLDWLDHGDTSLEEITELLLQALISAVLAANGRVFDLETELATLARVTSPDKPSAPNRSRRIQSGSARAATNRARRA